LALASQSSPAIDAGTFIETAAQRNASNLVVSIAEAGKRENVIMRPDETARPTSQSIADSFVVSRKNHPCRACELASDSCSLGVARAALHSAYGNAGWRAAAELKRWITATAPVLTVPVTPRRRARRRSHERVRHLPRARPRALIATDV
jgi:hypothetical protein